MITVYSTPNCVNCNALKVNFKANQIAYEEKTIGVDITKEDLEALAGTVIRSAPAIIKDNVYIGGIAEGLALLNSIKTEKALAAQKEMQEELKSLGISL
jgi:glutaredoxin